MTAERIVLDPVERDAGSNYLANPKAGLGATTGYAVENGGVISAVSLGAGGAPSASDDLRRLGLVTGIKIVGAAGNDGIEYRIPYASLPAASGYYALSFYLYVVSNSATNIRTYFYDFTDELPSVDSTLLGSWERIEIVHNFTDISTGSAVLGPLIVQNGSGASEFYITGVQVEHASTVGVYFDGDRQSPTPTVRYAWAGAPHLSTSTAVVGRDELDITDWILQEGIDWGEATVDPFMADKDRGSVPVDFRIPNRPISVPLRFTQTQGGTTTVQARANIQAKAALFQKEGGWIRRVTNSGGTVYADVVDAGLIATSVSGWESAADVDIDAHLALTCLPDFYQAELALNDHTEQTKPDFTFTETGIEGDYPSRVRIVVDDDQGQIQQGMIWGFRSRHYSSASTAALAYEAEALNPVGGGAAAATTGASGGTAVKVAPLFATWTPVVSTPIGGATHLTHTGTYRAFARCIVSGTVGTQVRLSWDVGDLTNPITNDPRTLPNPGAGTAAGTAIYDVQLGEVRLDPSPVGTHRWQGQIEAQAFNTISGTADFRVDRIEFQPVDEGAGMLTSPIVAPSAASSLVGFDSYEQSAGTLTGAVAPLGGTWTTLGTAGSETGDADDFNLTGSSTYNVTRNPGTADSSGTNGRFLTLGTTTYSAADARVDVSLPYLASNGEVRGGLLLRAATTDVYLVAYRRHEMINPVTAYTYLSLIKKSGGILTGLGNVQITQGFQTGSYTIRMTIDSSGNIAVYTAPAGSSDLGAAKISVTDNALSAGKVGLYDATTIASAGTRTYDNFRVYAPSGTTVSDAVIYASRSMQLTTDGAYRLDTGGTAYGPVSKVVGDLPRLPVAGLEGRTTEVFLKASRGDFESVQDAGIDDISARVFYRPSWLHVDDT